MGGELCEALAELGSQLCYEMLDPTTISVFVARSLIPLGKNPPEVWPIGICKVACRVISKVVLSTVNPEFKGLPAL